MRRLVLLLFVLGAWLGTSPVQAGTHVARSGETLDNLALRYYGQIGRAMVIRAANGFVHPDDGSLLPGERVTIPEVTLHRLQSGETFERLADRHLGSAQRGRFLAELNGSPERMPPPGTIIKIPFQLLHILAEGEKLDDVARLYFGRRHDAAWLAAYNLRAERSFRRGAAVLVPLDDLELTAEGRQLLGVGTEQAGEEALAAQKRATAELAKLREAYQTGHYVEAVGRAERLLATGNLTDPQKVGALLHLGYAAVALGERDLAETVFVQALAVQPGIELSPIMTSPKILEVFRRAKAATATKP